MRDQTIKADAGKPQIHLVPPQIIRDIAEVRAYGVAKYGDSDRWKEVELDRYIDALMRHALAFMENPESKDNESGISHYKHMACNLAFICELMKENDVWAMAQEMKEHISITKDATCNLEGYIL